MIYEIVLTAIIIVDVTLVGVILYLGLLMV